MLDAKTFLTNRKLMSSLSIVILALSTVALGALFILRLETLTYGEDSPPAEVEAAYRTIKLTARLNKTTYALGEPVKIALELANTSNKTVFLAGSSIPMLGFTVFNEWLQPIYESYSLGCPVVVSYPVEPSESLNRTLTWAQKGRYGLYFQDIYKQVDPGFYFLIGRTAPSSGVIYDIEEPSIELETPKICIEIKATTSAKETSSHVSVETTKFPLKLTMMLNKTTFELNEIVEIAFSLKNIGNETLPLTLCECNFGFVVYDESGSVVYDYNKNHAYPCVYIPTPLPPGLCRSGTLSWYQQYNPVFRGWGQDPLFEYRKVSCGRYWIVGEFTSVLDRIPLRTPPVTITIGP